MKHNYRRIIRRETHSPRSVAAITLAIVLMLVLAWIGTEIVLHLLARPALLVAPADMLDAAKNVPELPGEILIGSGIVVALLGIALLVLALNPGRRGRHARESERAAVILDDRVIASAVSDVVARSANVAPGQAHVSVGKRDVSIDVTPISGVPIDRETVRLAAQTALDDYRVEPKTSARVRLSGTGTVGA